MIKNLIDSVYILNVLQKEIEAITSSVRNIVLRNENIIDPDLQNLIEATLWYSVVKLNSFLDELQFFKGNCVRNFTNPKFLKHKCFNKLNFVEMFDIKKFRNQALAHNLRETGNGRKIEREEILKLKIPYSLPDF